MFELKCDVLDFNAEQRLHKGMSYIRVYVVYDRFIDVYLFAWWNMLVNRSQRESVLNVFSGSSASRNVTLPPSGDCMEVQWWVWDRPN